MTDKEVMQMALTALCNSSQPAWGYRRNELHLTPKPHIEIYQEAIEALRARLAQPEPEPVAWIDRDDPSTVAHNKISVKRLEELGSTMLPLYTAYPQSKPHGYLQLKTAKFYYELEGVIDHKNYLPLYTAPPAPTKLINVNGVLEQAGYAKKKEWVGLTDEERSELWWNTDMGGMPEHDYGKKVEALLKEKNSGI